MKSESKEDVSDVTKNTKPKQQATKAELKGEPVVKREQKVAARQLKPKKKAVAPIMEISSDDDVDEVTCQRIRSHERTKITLKPRPTPSPEKPEMFFCSIGTRPLYCKDFDMFTETVANHVDHRFRCTYASKEPPSLYIDCRGFKRRGAWDLVFHVGENIEILKCTAADPLLIDVIRETKAHAMIWQQHNCTSCAIAMLCSSGTHRCVSVTRIIGEAFRLNGYDVEIEHLARKTWSKRGKCDSCASCLLTQWEKPALYGWASERFAECK